MSGDGFFHPPAGTPRTGYQHLTDLFKREWLKGEGYCSPPAHPRRPVTRKFTPWGNHHFGWWYLLLASVALNVSVVAALLFPVIS